MNQIYSQEHIDEHKKNESDYTIEKGSLDKLKQLISISDRNINKPTKNFLYSFLLQKLAYTNFKLNKYIKNSEKLIKDKRILDNSMAIVDTLSKSSGGLTDEDKNNQFPDKKTILMDLQQTYKLKLLCSCNILEKIGFGHGFTMIQEDGQELKPAYYDIYKEDIIKVNFGSNPHKLDQITAYDSSFNILTDEQIYLENILCIEEFNPQTGAEIKANIPNELSELCKEAKFKYPIFCIIYQPKKLDTDGRGKDVYRTGLLFRKFKDSEQDTNYKILITAETGHYGELSDFINIQLETLENLMDEHISTLDIAEYEIEDKHNQLEYILDDIKLINDDDYKVSQIINRVEQKLDNFDTEDKIQNINQEIDKIKNLYGDSNCSQKINHKFEELKKLTECLKKGLDTKMEMIKDTYDEERIKHIKFNDTSYSLQTCVKKAWVGMTLKEGEAATDFTARIIEKVEDAITECYENPFYTKKEFDNQYRYLRGDRPYHKILKFLFNNETNFLDDYTLSDKIKSKFNDNIDLLLEDDAFIRDMDFSGLNLLYSDIKNSSTQIEILKDSILKKSPYLNIYNGLLNTLNHEFQLNPAFEGLNNDAMFDEDKLHSMNNLNDNIGNVYFKSGTKTQSEWFIQMIQNMSNPKEYIINKLIDEKKSSILSDIEKYLNGLEPEYENGDEDGDFGVGEEAQQKLYDLIWDDIKRHFGFDINKYNLLNNEGFKEGLDNIFNITVIDEHGYLVDTNSTWDKWALDKDDIINFINNILGKKSQTNYDDVNLQFNALIDENNLIEQMKTHLYLDCNNIEKLEEIHNDYINVLIDMYALFKHNHLIKENHTHIIEIQKQVDELLGKNDFNILKELNSYIEDETTVLTELHKQVSEYLKEILGLLLKEELYIVDEKGKINYTQKDKYEDQIETFNDRLEESATISELEKLYEEVYEFIKQRGVKDIYEIQRVYEPRLIKNKVDNAYACLCNSQFTQFKDNKKSKCGSKDEYEELIESINKAEKNEAISNLQAAARRLKPARNLAKQKKAATKIQTVERGNRARKLAQKIREAPIKDISFTEKADADPPHQSKGVELLKQFLENSYEGVDKDDLMPNLDNIPVIKLKNDTIAFLYYNKENNTIEMRYVTENSSVVTAVGSLAKLDAAAEDVKTEWYKHFILKSSESGVYFAMKTPVPPYLYFMKYLEIEDKDHKKIHDDFPYTIGSSLDEYTDILPNITSIELFEPEQVRGVYFWLGDNIGRILAGQFDMAEAAGYPNLLEVGSSGGTGSAAETLRYIVEPSEKYNLGTIKQIVFATLGPLKKELLFINSENGLFIVEYPYAMVYAEFYKNLFTDDHFKNLSSIKIQNNVLHTMKDSVWKNYEINIKIEHVGGSPEITLIDMVPSTIKELSHNVKNLTRYSERKVTEEYNELLTKYSDYGEKRSALRTKLNNFYQNKQEHITNIALNTLKQFNEDKKKHSEDIKKELKDRQHNFEELPYSNETTEQEDAKRDEQEEIDTLQKKVENMSLLSGGALDSYNYYRNIVEHGMIDNIMKIEFYILRDLINTAQYDDEDKDTTGYNETEKLLTLEGGLSGRDELLDAIAKGFLQFSIDSKAYSKGGYLNAIAYGPPGSGKTTFANILAKVYYINGLILQNKVYTVSKSDLIGQYVGQTAPLVKSWLIKAREAVLFIDEAYAVSGCEWIRDDKGQIIDFKNDPFGKEAITEIVNWADKNIETSAIIAAGYKDEMLKCFLGANEGMPRRFLKTYELTRLGANELYGILANQLADKINIGDFECGNQYKKHFITAIIAEFTINLLEIVDSPSKNEETLLPNGPGDISNIVGFITKNIGINIGTIFELSKGEPMPLRSVHFKIVYAFIEFIKSKQADAKIQFTTNDNKIIPVLKITIKTTNLYYKLSLEEITPSEQEPTILDINTLNIDSSFNNYIKINYYFSIKKIVEVYQEKYVDIDYNGAQELLSKLQDKIQNLPEYNNFEQLYIGQDINEDCNFAVDKYEQFKKNIEAGLNSPAEVSRPNDYEAVEAMADLMNLQEQGGGSRLYQQKSGAVNEMKQLLAKTIYRLTKNNFRFTNKDIDNFEYIEQNKNLINDDETEEAYYMVTQLIDTHLNNLK